MGRGGRDMDTVSFQLVWGKVSLVQVSKSQQHCWKLWVWPILKVNREWTVGIMSAAQFKSSAVNKSEIWFTLTRSILNAQNQFCAIWFFFLATGKQSKLPGVWGWQSSLVRQAKTQGNKPENNRTLHPWAQRGACLCDLDCFFLPL